MSSSFIAFFTNRKVRFGFGGKLHEYSFFLQEKKMS